MAGQWFALPKLFKDSTNKGYEITVNEPKCERPSASPACLKLASSLIQFKNEQSWTFLPPIPKVRR
jgi:hypothetical protein